MKTLIDPSVSPSAFTLPERASRGATPATPARSDDHRLRVRLVERFALVAFALYHLPLFLNNYPSLGGGGMSQTGLAISWGHVFTAPGIWVARHVFGLTGPMTSGIRGDNGDVAEEFARLLLAVVVGAVAAATWTTLDRRKPRGRWAGEALRVLLRYSIALGLTSYAIAKILPLQFPPLDASTLEQRVGDLSPMALLWQFMQYSRPYAFFGGLMELVVVVLLAFRRTATLGALLCLVVMTNVAVLNYAYSVPVKLYSTMIVASAVVLVLYDHRRMRALFVTNETVPPATAAPLLQGRISERVRWTAKVVLVGSVVVSSILAMNSVLDSQRTTPSAVEGGWVVTAFTRDGQPLDSTGNPARWRRFVITGYGILIRLESDSLLGCGRMSSSDPATIGFSCAKGRKGELRSTRTGDRLVLDGVFDGHTMTATGRRLSASDYRLVRSRFRWLED